MNKNTFPIFIFAVVIGLITAPHALAGGDATRRVELTYAVTIDQIPEDARVIDLWMPVPSDTDGQKVSKTHVLWPEGGTIATEPEYGNRIYHKRFTAPRDNAKMGAEIRYEISRNEIVIPQAKTLPTMSSPKPTVAFAAYLQPDRLIPIDGQIDIIAKELDLKNETPLRAGRKIYDYLINEMSYDWRAPGAGKGDVRWACDTKSGDCTDYSSVLIALLRNQGIPADHEFGFPIRSPRDSGRIPSYHCWVRFFVDGVGWIPVDTSEADKHPELRDYNFGSQKENLMKFTHGRDIILQPPQQGPP